MSPDALWIRIRAIAKKIGIEKACRSEIVLHCLPLYEAYKKEALEVLTRGAAEEGNE
jgi:hypothetical protein